MTPPIFIKKKRKWSCSGTLPTSWGLLWLAFPPGFFYQEFQGHVLAWGCPSQGGFTLFQPLGAGVPPCRGMGKNSPCGLGGGET